MPDYCRLCANSERNCYIPIFGLEGTSLALCYKINFTTDIQIAQDDPLPKSVCSLCIEQLESTLQFQEQCRKTQIFLRELLIKKSNQSFDNSSPQLQESPPVAQPAEKDSLANGPVARLPLNGNKKKKKGRRQAEQAADGNISSVPVSSKNAKKALVADPKTQKKQDPHISPDQSVGTHKNVASKKHSSKKNPKSGTGEKAPVDDEIYVIECEPRPVDVIDLTDESQALEHADSTAENVTAVEPAPDAISSQPRNKRKKSVPKRSELSRDRLVTPSPVQSDSGGSHVGLENQPSASVTAISASATGEQNDTEDRFTNASLSQGRNGTTESPQDVGVDNANNSGGLSTGTERPCIPTTEIVSPSASIVNVPESESRASAVVDPANGQCSVAQTSANSNTCADTPILPGVHAEPVCQSLSSGDKTNSPVVSQVQAECSTSGSATGPASSSTPCAVARPGLFISPNVTAVTPIAVAGPSAATFHVVNPNPFGVFAGETRRGLENQPTADASRCANSAVLEKNLAVEPVTVTTQPPVSLSDSTASVVQVIGTSAEGNFSTERSYKKVEWSFMDAMEKYMAKERLTSPANSASVSRPLFSCADATPAQDREVGNLASMKEVYQYMAEQIGKQAARNPELRNYESITHLAKEMSAQVAESNVVYKRRILQGLRKQIGNEVIKVRKLDLSCGRIEKETTGVQTSKTPEQVAGCVTDSPISEQPLMIFGEPFSLETLLREDIIQNLLKYQSENFSHKTKKPRKRKQPKSPAFIVTQNETNCIKRVKHVPVAESKQITQVSESSGGPSAAATAGCDKAKDAACPHTAQSSCISNANESVEPCATANYPVAGWTTTATQSNPQEGSSSGPPASNHSADKALPEKQQLQGSSLDDEVPTVIKHYLISNKSHGEGLKFTCRICNKYSCDSEPQCTFHVLHCHKNELVTCKICQEKYPVCGILEHTNSCQSKKRNPGKGQPLFKKNVRKHPPGMHQCRTCEQVFWKASDLQWHTGSHESPEYFVCHVCGERFHFRMEFNNHMRFHWYRCHACKVSFQARSEFEMHVITHVKNEG